MRSFVLKSELWKLFKDAKVIKVKRKMRFEKVRKKVLTHKYLSEIFTSITSQCHRENYWTSITVYRQFGDSNSQLHKKLQKEPVGGSASWETGASWGRKI